MSVVEDVGRVVTTLSELLHALRVVNGVRPGDVTKVDEALDAIRRIGPLAVAGEKATREPPELSLGGRL